MRRHLITIMTITSAGVALAIPAKPGLIRYTQPDGTSVEVRLKGDECGYVLFSADDMLLVNRDGCLEYAEFESDGTPVSSGLVVGKTTLTESQKKILQSGQQISDWVARVNADRLKKYEEIASFRKTKVSNHAYSQTINSDEDEDDQQGSDRQWSVPWRFTLSNTSFKTITGSPKALVLLVEYSDVPFTFADHDYFDRMLNEEGFSDYGSLSSVKDYFAYNSMGQFTPDFDVYGPVTLPKVRAYYGGNDFRDNDQFPHMMAVHAMEILDDEVDFTQYDCDGDGVIDNVFIFYAGQGEHDSALRDAVWPHSYDLTYADPHNEYYFDGVLLDHYACTCEHPTGEDRPDGIGTFIHEFSHVMGLPDLYSTTYTSAFTPGSFQVLDEGPYNNDGLTPPNYSSYERCALGWIELKPFEEGLNEIPELTQSNVAYVIPTERKNEYYFLENRQQIGNDQFIPGHGMLVWHIDYDEKVWERNAVNNSASHQYVDLVEADNKKLKNSRDGDPFPGVKEITEFGPSTKPALVSWNKKNLIFGLSDIIESEDGIITLTANALETELPPYVDPGQGKVEGIGSESGDGGVIYDLTGRRVNNPERGVYLQNGKKILIK